MLEPQEDCVDAEFVTIPNDATPSRPFVKRARPIAVPVHEPDPATQYFDQAEGKRWQPWSGEPLSAPAFYSLGLCIILISFWVSGGHNLFVEPQKLDPIIVASVEKPLTIENVEWQVRYRAQRPVLMVKGHVHNPHETGQRPRDLMIRARYPDGKTEKLFLKAHGQPLAGGSDYQFHGQLDLNRREIASVTVSFQSE